MVDPAWLAPPPDPPPDAAPTLVRTEYRLVIRCVDEAHQRDLLAILDQAGLDVRPLIA